MTTLTIIETLAAIKGVTSFQIKNIDTFAGTFELNRSVYSYEMTANGKYVKSGSVKFLNTISNFQNASY